jgi:phytoene dehydrogenase-like protein
VELSPAPSAKTGEVLLSQLGALCLRLAIRPAASPLPRAAALFETCRHARQSLDLGYPFFAASVCSNGDAGVLPPEPTKTRRERERERESRGPALRRLRFLIVQIWPFVQSVLSICLAISQPSGLWRSRVL